MQPIPLLLTDQRQEGQRHGSLSKIAQPLPNFVQQIGRPSFKWSLPSVARLATLATSLGQPLKDRLHKATRGWVIPSGSLMLAYRAKANDNFKFKISLCPRHRPQGDLKLDNWKLKYIFCLCFCSLCPKAYGPLAFCPFIAKGRWAKVPPA
jgi:hypothetical protein